MGARWQEPDEGRLHGTARPSGLLPCDAILPERSTSQRRAVLLLARPALQVVSISGYTADVLGPQPDPLPHQQRER
jgi:hypothetical protein